MKSLLLNTKTRQFKEVDYDGKLETFYRLLDCDCIDVCHRKIGGKYFCIVVDDEGLLKENPVVSGVSPDGDVMLIGNLMFFSDEATENGDFIGITSEDIDLIKENAGEYMMVSKDDMSDMRFILACKMEY